VSIFGGRYEKLSQNDIDYKVFDKHNKLIAYAEVTGRMRNISNAYPLPISCRKLVKLLDKRLNPVLIWACDDGIIYGKLKDIRGDIMYSNDIDLMAYYEKKKYFKYVRYT
jgi:hypothetical protein